ncbi:MAG: hypothetical protein ABI594_01410 [Ginsengibacter sp.]
MNAKKFFTVLLFTMFTVSVIPAFAGEPIRGEKTENANLDVRAQQVANRLIEIRNMDKSNLTSSEKKALRKEVKEIKKEVRANSNGIYLSVGAIIIIILLLLLLL